MPNYPLVSIVICTHHRSDLLRLVLESLVNQETVPPGTFDVIVVDNDLQPNPAVRAAVEDFSNNLPLRYIYEPKVGLSNARNTGGQAASAEYIGYIDDDAKVPPHYLRKAREIIEQQSPDFFGGPFFPFYLSQKPLWFKDEYGTHTMGETPHFLDEHFTLTGSNIFLIRSVFEKSGWFDPEYGMKGSGIGYAEETELQLRARRQNPCLRVFYDPELYIWHLVPKRKMSLFWKFASSFQLGRSIADLFENDKPVPRGFLEKVMELTRTISLLIIDLIYGFIPTKKSGYESWQNYLYEKTSRKFVSLGQQYHWIEESFKQQQKRP